MNIVLKMVLVLFFVNGASALACNTRYQKCSDSEQITGRAAALLVEALYSASREVLTIEFIGDEKEKVTFNHMASENTVVCELQIISDAPWRVEEDTAVCTIGPRN